MNKIVCSLTVLLLAAYLTEATPRRNARAEGGEGGSSGGLPIDMSNNPMMGAIQGLMSQFGGGSGTPAPEGRDGLFGFAMPSGMPDFGLPTGMPDMGIPTGMPDMSALTGGSSGGSEGARK